MDEISNERESVEQAIERLIEMEIQDDATKYQLELTKTELFLIRQGIERQRKFWIRGISKARNANNQENLKWCKWWLDRYNRLERKFMELKEWTAYDQFDDRTKQDWI